MLWIQVLGALVAEVDGDVLALGGPVPRRLLSALTIAVGTPMSDDELVGLVWAGRPPHDAIGALRVVVSRLRSGLGEAFRGLLTRAPLGYQLNVVAAQLDTSMFVDAVTAGRAALHAGDAERAEGALRRGLELWRGRPWDDLGDEPSLLGPRSELIELREEAFEDLQAARLARGDAPGAVAALSGAVVESPYRERRWELLALGLYRTGRQTQALAELRRVRELLDSELGVAPGPALQELEARILRHDGALTVPPSHVATDSGLPRRADHVRLLGSLSTFVGRVQESATLAQMIQKQRLVTLVGPAGVGKTRLAFEFVSRYSRDAVDADVWVVRLADVNDPDEVVGAIADHVGVTLAIGDPVAHLRRALIGRSGLLVLDNCEHVVDGVRDVVSRLLPGATSLRILATSRQLIGVDGEYLVDVAPMPVSDGNGNDGDAIRLLYQRVKSARPQWEPTPAERVAARVLCAQLDGLPLAIELAASRVRSLGLAELTHHLAKRFDVLGHTSIGSVTPHATLQAAIGWSVDQLVGADRDMLLRLWPFEGGFTWQAAEFVAPRDGSGGSVLAVLASLVDRSVIVADTANGVTRYRLLETIRRYCADLDPDPNRTRDAHAEWVRRYVADNVDLMVGTGARGAFDAIRTEMPNIRAGIAHDMDHRPHDALRTVAALDWVWISFGVVSEGIGLLRRVLEACPDASPEDRTRALIALSNNLYQAGDTKGAAEMADEADATVPLSSQVTDGWRLLSAWARIYRVVAAIDLGDVAAATEHLDRYSSCVESVVVPDWLASCALLCTGLTEVMAGDVAAGIVTLQRAGELGREIGFLWTQGSAEVMVARVELRSGGDAKHATKAAARALTAFATLGDMGGQLSALHCGAHCLFLSGAVREAVRLRAAVLKHADEMGFDLNRLADLAGGDNEALLREALSEPERSVVEADGRAMTFDEMTAAFRRYVDAL